jgi:hypothetical protein
MFTFAATSTECNNDISKRTMAWHKNPSLLNHTEPLFLVNTISSVVAVGCLPIPYSLSLARLNTIQTENSTNSSCVSSSGEVGKARKSRNPEQMGTQCARRPPGVGRKISDQVCNPITLPHIYAKHHDSNISATDFARVEVCGPIPTQFDVQGI